MSSIKNTPSDDSYVELSSQSSGNGNGNGTLLRALTIASPTGLEVQIPVPSQPFDAWIVADVLREDFQRSLAASPETTDVLEVQEEQDDADSAAKVAGEAKMNLAAKFLGFLASRASVKTSSHELNVLHHAWSHFHEDILAEHGSVHDLVSAVDSDLRTSILRSYFEAFAQLESAGKAKPALVTPKLFSLSADNKAEVHAVFGGQGNNEVSFLTLFPYSSRSSIPFPVISAHSDGELDLQLLLDQLSAGKKRQQSITRHHSSAFWFSALDLVFVPFRVAFGFLASWFYLSVTRWRKALDRSSLGTSRALS